MLRPGIWVTRSVQKEMEEVVQRLVVVSRHLKERQQRRYFSPAPRKPLVDLTEQEISGEEEVSEASSDSGAAENLHKFPWMRQHQQQEQQQQKQRKHRKQESKQDHETSSSRSSSPTYPFGGTVAGVSTLGFPAAQKTTKAKGTATSVLTSVSSDSSEKPSSVIYLDSSSSDSESAVVEVYPQHPAREANRQKRKKRKQRQAMQRAKLRKRDKVAAEAPEWLFSR